MSILMEPKGIWSILVNVGDQVTAGQPIVHYSSTEAQTAYDAAVRVNKADRQLNDLLTNGVTIDTTGDEEADAKSACRPSEQSILKLTIYEMLSRMRSII